MYIYYHSCNFAKLFPKTDQKILSYLATQPDVNVAGCCLTSSDAADADDIIIYVCLSCYHMLKAMRPEVKQISLFEFLLTREDIVWPDLKGEEITVQDCFRARGLHGIQNAVRECLHRMNAEIVEMENNRDEELYDGAFLYHDPSPANVKIAPKYFVDHVSKYLTIIPKEQWKDNLREHAGKYTTSRVVCYCNTCTSGAVEGGAQALHLAELIF